MYKNNLSINSADVERKTEILSVNRRQQRNSEYIIYTFSLQICISESGAKRLTDKGLDNKVCFPVTNILYFTGFSVSLEAI